MAVGLDIRFGRCVTRMCWHDKGAHVTCQDGQELHADAVICTLPLGVLKVQFDLLPSRPYSYIVSMVRPAQTLVRFTKTGRWF